MHVTRDRGRLPSRRRMGGCRDPRHPSRPGRPRLVGRGRRARTLRVRLRCPPGSRGSASSCAAPTASCTTSRPRSSKCDDDRMPPPGRARHPPCGRGEDMSTLPPDDPARGLRFRSTEHLACPLRRGPRRRRAARSEQRTRRGRRPRTRPSTPPTTCWSRPQRISRRPSTLLARAAADFGWGIELAEPRRARRSTFRPRTARARRGRANSTCPPSTGSQIFPQPESGQGRPARPADRCVAPPAADACAQRPEAARA